jgi:ATP-binding cassette subfamily A (ABC1) protein 3
MAYLIPSLLAFGSSVVTNSYMWGFIYSKSQSAYKGHGVFCLAILYYVPFFFGVLGQVKNIVWVEYLFRTCGYLLGPFVLMQDELLNYTNGNILNADLLSSQKQLFPILLLIQSVLYLLVTVFLESRKYNLSLQKVNKPRKEIKENPIFDATEINSEANRVQEENNTDPIKVLNLEKTYENGYQAVRGVSFGVEKKQIFGLLGPNGAGKSTTFSILTALNPRTSGSVKLMNTEIDNNLYEIFKEVGICPQFDPLWEELTVFEHLEVFGGMKGLQGDELRENINFYIKTMQLSDQVNKKSKILSGGNKRKLCVTDALIGSPSLQFFDEPSTGLDPVARRYLYETLTNNLKFREASIILTTHSLTEAEMLCHKIGILINGKFVCIGSTPYLKNKYGTGYRIEIPRNAIMDGQ